MVGFELNLVRRSAGLWRLGDQRGVGGVGGGGRERKGNAMLSPES